MRPLNVITYLIVNLLTYCPLLTVQLHGILNGLKR